jgi:pimeloyl-ACP methyl ester carboxylesterase
MRTDNGEGSAGCGSICPGRAPPGHRLRQHRLRPVRWRGHARDLARSHRFSWRLRGPSTGRLPPGCGASAPCTDTVIAPDLRGAGDSERTRDGYDKKTLAKDIRGLVRQLGEEQVQVVRHDIGLMVRFQRRGSEGGRVGADGQRRIGPAQADEDEGPAGCSRSAWSGRSWRVIAGGRAASPARGCGHAGRSPGARCRYRGRAGRRRPTTRSWASASRPRSDRG